MAKSKQQVAENTSDESSGRKKPERDPVRQAYMERARTELSIAQTEGKIRKFDADNLIKRKELTDALVKLQDRRDELTALLTPTPTLFVGDAQTVEAA